MEIPQSLLLKNLIESLHGLKPSSISGKEEPKDGIGLKVLEVKPGGVMGEDEDKSPLAEALESPDEEAKEGEGGGDDDEALFDLIKKLKV